MTPDLPTYAAIMRTIEARRELQRMVEANRNSFEVEQFRRKRAAALKHTRAGS